MPDNIERDVTDGDREFAAKIIEDFAEFEEGIEDQERMAQWVRNVRIAALYAAYRKSVQMHDDWIKRLRKLVDEQAQDDGLWFIDSICSEAYLQAALRRLHAAIEDATDAR